MELLLRKEEITLPKNTCEIQNTIDGRIETVIVDGAKFDYYEDFEKFFTNAQPMQTYSLFNDKILFPAFDKIKIVEIIYYTKNHAKNAEGKEKYLMEEDTDSTLIPEPFAEPVLVYGACMRLKGNPQHVRFSYWMSMYRDALANMRSRVSASIDETPSVKMHRR